MVFIGVIHPLLQLGVAVNRTGRVIGRAKIDKIRFDRRVGQRQKSVVRVGVHIKDLSSVHNVGVHIHRVNRIRHQNGIILAEQV